MRTKNLSFQLEQTMPSIFLLQGAFAGLVAGLVYTAAICFWNPPFMFIEAIFISPFFLVLGSVAGVIKSIIMWLPYRLTRIQVHPVTRVAITSICTGAGALLLALKFGYGFESPSDTAAWVLTMLLGGLPTAVLVGSSVKPWELFTFGSIAVGDSRTGGRVGSRSIAATLATLPLRFLSLIALGVWILTCACRFHPVARMIGPFVAFPFIYLLCTTYVTFRSPHRVLLLVSGILLNLPVGVVTYFAFKIKPASYFYTEAFPYVFVIGSAFLLAWVIFLVARLTAPTQRLIRETGFSHVEHHCLGARFMEWQERHAA